MYRNVIYHRNWNGTAVVILLHAFLPDRLRLFHLDTILSTLNWSQLISTLHLSMLQTFTGSLCAQVGLQQKSGGSRRVQDPLTSRRVCCETPRHPDILHAGCIKGYVLFPCGCSTCSQGFSEISTFPWFVPRRVATSSQKALDARAPKAKLEMPTAMPSQRRNLQLFWEIV